MKKFKTLVVAIIFFIVSALFIANYHSFLFFLPAQQVELSHGVEYGAVVKNFLFVQELTMQKRYISRVDLYMAKLPSPYLNEDVFLLVDKNHRILFTKKFSSSEFGEALYFPFDFGKSFDIGKGNKVYACIYSIDGNQSSYIGLAKKENSNLGKLYVVSIVNNDIVQSFEQQTGLVEFKGSIGVRTYESESLYFSFFQFVLYFVAIVLSLLIFFSVRIKQLFLKTRIKPEYAFLCLSLFVGSIMVVINPPFQVPDEPVHFFRSYQISELNIFKIRDDIPKSLVEFAAICDRMRFSTHEKTNRREILSLSEINLNPRIRTSVITPNLTIPYIPQAAGIVIGKILHLNPLWLLYLGRVFNLLVSVVLVFLAIRTTPVLKWLFFLLGIMPMTLYQFSSLSYDALTIGLSFLLISAILKLALDHEKRIASRELLLLFVLSGLLAAAKPPYFIIAFLMIIIPVAKIGDWKKFSMVFAAMVSMVLIISQLWAPGRKLYERFGVTKDAAPKTAFVCLLEEATPERVPSHYKRLVANLPLLPHGHPGVSSPEKADSKTVEKLPEVHAQQNEGNGDTTRHAINQIDPSAQKKFILDDPVRYTGIMFRTFLKSAGLYMISFVGMFGWVDTPLPDFLAYIYLFVLLLVSIVSPSKGIQIGFVRKCILFAALSAIIILVETAMYLYCNPVGAPAIIAVQGRYFIAVGPLWFLLFYNNQVIRMLGKFPALPEQNPINFRQNAKKKSTIKTTPDGTVFSGFLPWFAVTFGSFSLIYALYMIFERFYVFTM